MRRSGLAVATIVFTIAAFVAWKRSNVAWGVDFAQFWLGGQLARHDGSALYQSGSQRLGDEALRTAFASQRSSNLLSVIRHREELSRMQGQEWLSAFTGTPFLYTVFGTLPPNYDTALLIYRAICLIATIAACLILCHLAGLSPPVSLILTAGVLLLFEPLSSDQRVSNVNQIQLAALAVYMWLLSRAPMLSGAVIAGAVLFKPTLVFVPLLVIAYRFIRAERARGFRELAGMSIGGAAVIVASSLFFGTAAAWTSWLEMARRLSGSEIPRAAGNIALFNATAIVTAILFAAAIVVLLRSEATVDNALLASLGTLIYLLGANLVWLHYPVLALPAALLLLSRRFSTFVRIGSGVALSLIALKPWAPFVRAYDINVQATMIAGGLVILFVLLVHECAGQRVSLRRQVPASQRRASTRHARRSDSRRKFG
jgi:hypothetical protein